MKETFFFSHDYNARSDHKIKKLMSKHGITGYGIFWAIIEDLYNNANALQLDYDVIAYDLRVDSDMVKSVLNDFDLFVISDGFVSSKSVESRLAKRVEKSLKASESARARWDKKEENADEMRTHTECNTNKGKESKGKEKKKEEDINISFDVFWNAYGKKKDKINSEKKWKSLSQADREKAIADIPAYLKTTPDVNFRKDPLTYLNGKCWLDREDEVQAEIKKIEKTQEADKDLSPEILSERKERREWYAKQIKTTHSLTGRLEFPNHLCVYHAFRGFSDDLELEKSPELLRHLFG